MWSVDEAMFRRLPTEGFVFVEGEMQAYQGDLQLIIQHIEALSHPSAEQLRDLLPATERDPAEMFAELASELRALRHPAMRALAEVYLADEHLMERLRAAPAAKSMHHARIGGLLEHTLSLVRVARVVCPLYPRISEDLVVMGLFLHDLGKTLELSYDGPFNYTDRGELVGHIVDGVIMLHDRAQQLMHQGVRLPPNTLMVLQHIILSHHGEPEHGAAKRPSTPEAILVHALDNMDAKLDAALDAARPAHAGAEWLGGNFTERVWSLEAKMFRPDPLA